MAPPTRHRAFRSTDVGGPPCRLFGFVRFTDVGTPPREVWLLELRPSHFGPVLPQVRLLLLLAVFRSPIPLRSCASTFINIYTSDIVDILS